VSSPTSYDVQLLPSPSTGTALSNTVGVCFSGGPTGKTPRTQCWNLMTNQAMVKELFGQ
jgi:hypothetical protein